jgi:hypothetical protein
MSFIRRIVILLIAAFLLAAPLGFTGCVVHDHDGGWHHDDWHHDDWHH